MNGPQDVLEHKTLMVALLASAGEIAAALGVDADLPVAAMARALGANRTSVYAQRHRLVRALTELVAAGPGRPPGQCDTDRASSREEMALTIRVLEFRVQHLDAVVEHASRTSYSPSFRRFILSELDGWPGTTPTFAAACRVPLDTLKDWVSEDRERLQSGPPARQPVVVAVDASETAKAIVKDFEVWEGATRDFPRVTARRYGVTASQVARLLRICGLIASRPRRAFRHRGTTQRLCPGALLVTDGKTVSVELTGSGTRTSKNWQGIADQATGCDTAVVVTKEEDAAAIGSAFSESVEFLGGVAPDGLLHDNKPCHEEAELRSRVEGMGTMLVAATLGRAENKALLEGAFSLFEERVGTIRLDDSSMASLIHSAVGEIVRAYTAATNGVPPAELGGLSRQAALRSARPSREQQAADRAFIRRLKERHDRQRESKWREKVKPASRRLLSHVFARLELADRDPYGRLRQYLSIYEPAAIRQAAPIVALRLDRGELRRKQAHRYLTKVIQAKQEELDLERQASDLFELCRWQAQDWVSTERAQYEDLQHGTDPEALACALAERAAWGGLPVRGAFWTEKLVELLESAPQLLDQVRRFLVRLYEAPSERRLLLLDRLAALEAGVA